MIRHRSITIGRLQFVGALKLGKLGNKVSLKLNKFSSSLSTEIRLRFRKADLADFTAPKEDGTERIALKANRFEKDLN